MNRNPSVDAYMAKLESPLKNEIEAIREIILSTSDKITENITWAAPSFYYKGHLCTFNQRAFKIVSLTFHRGALIKDQWGLLEGTAKVARVARFYNMEDITQKKSKLIAVIKEWIKLMEHT